MPGVSRFQRVGIGRSVGGVSRRRFAGQIGRLSSGFVGQPIRKPRRLSSSLDGCCVRCASLSCRRKSRVARSSSAISSNWAGQDFVAAAGRRASPLGTGRQKSARPVGFAVGWLPAYILNRDERRQVVVQATQGIAHPGAGMGKPSRR